MALTEIPEEIIREIGGCGRYQIALAAIMHSMKAAVVFSMLTMVFAAATPKWWCYDDVMDDVMITSLNISEANQTMSNVNYSMNAVPLFKSCTNRQGDACRNIVYDYSMRTIHNEWELACSKEWVPSTIASIQMAGLFLGHLVSGQLADSFGRKVPMMLSLSMMFVFNVVAFFSTSWIMLGVARALIGCGMAFYLTIQYTMVSEVSTIRWRALNVNMPSWATEGCLCILLAYLFPNWRTMSLISGLISVPFMATWWFAPESFRWYLSHERYADARKAIERIAKFNGKQPPRELEHEMKIASESTKEEGDAKQYSLLDLVRNRGLLKITCICAMNWFSLGLTGYGIQFGIQALSGNFFLNIFTLFAIGIIPSLCVIYFSNRFGRKRTCISIFTLTALSSVGVGLVRYVEMDDVLRGRLTNGLAMLCSTSNGMAWGAVQTMTIELYPTVVRNIGYGLLNMCARVGAILGPQFAFLDTQLGGFMYFFICGVAILCATGTFFLSETRRADLPDRIA